MRTELLLLATLAGQAGVGGAAAPADTIDATIPIIVLDIDTALARGSIAVEPAWSAPRIAMQPARAVRGALREKSADVLVLTLLKPLGKTPAGEVQLDAPAERVAWCALPGLLSNLVECFQDLDSDGKFEIARTGMMGLNDVLSLSRVQAAKPISPVAYRAATEAELPVFHVGYQGCGTTLEEPQEFDGEFRFETAIRRRDEKKWLKVGRCDNAARLIEHRADGGKLFQMGRFKVEVRDEGSANEYSTQLVEGMPPGTILAHVRATWPLTNATELPPEAADISGNTSFLLVVGTPTIAVRAQPGEEIFAAEVRHRIAGRLSTGSLPRMRRDKNTLPAGTPVYGSAMTSSLMPYYDAEVVWCTPIRQPDGAAQPHCFAPVMGSTALVRANSTPYTARGVSLDPAPSRKAPIVERGPADFGAPLVLSIRIDKADKKNVGITYSLAPRGSRIDEVVRLRRAKDDAGFVFLGDLLLKITPAADARSFEISPIGQLQDGGPLELPRDATRLR